MVFLARFQSVFLELRLTTNWTKFFLFLIKEKQNDNKLKCSYFNKDPLLRIKPARMERVWEKPPIYIFRGFASKEEIEDLKAISGPQVGHFEYHCLKNV